jgi:endonuclease G
MNPISRFALRSLICFGTLVMLAGGAAFAAPLDGCSEHLPFGIPTVTTTRITMGVCHKGYAALVDEDRLVPLWVAYHLTGKHTFGCIARTDDFHEEDLLPADHRAKLADFERSGFDRGHQAPAQDFAWNAGEMHDSFSMANMAPQLPGLNRKEWERLEETVRVWAADRGELIVYVGPVITAHDDVIGPDRVDVPISFWKVVVDPAKQEALAFMMPQNDIPKGSLKPWEKSVADVETAAAITLPLPDGIDRTAVAAIWPADLTAWRVKHKSVCQP